jgi:predicted dehydrogenase
MKEVKIALIGAGNIANTHLDAYKRVAGAKVVAICDINEKRLNETADKFGIANRYTSVEAMLAAEKELDAADVCVWNCNHAKCAIAAMNAGLHVLCEKPMAYTAKEAEEMQACAEKNNRLLMIGFVTRFDTETLIVKDFIDNGYSGEIYYAKAQYVRRHGNPGGWFSDKSRSGGGPVIDLGVHVIDRARYLMGKPMPVSVYAATFNKLGRRDHLKTSVGWTPKDSKPEDICDVEDAGTALIRFDNGAVIQLETSYSINGEGVNGLDLYGTKGGFRTGKGELKVYTEINDYLTDVAVDTKNYKGARPMFEAEMAHFVDCVANNKPTTATAEDGVIVMKILDAIYESARTGHEVIIK